MIDGVVVKDLVVHQDERGWLMEVLRKDDPQFKGFGQAYITTTYEGVVKAWHLHSKQIDNVCCISGTIKLVLSDILSDEEPMVIYLGDRAPKLVTIPARVWHGWMSVEGTAVIMNCATEVYNPANPDEERLPAHSTFISYDWTRVDK